MIEIADFDLTPCGGTHASSTGEVGIIAVRGWERAKGLVRIQFMAGIRALADYRKANHTARATAALFSAGREDSPDLVAKLVDDNKRLTRRVAELEEIACRVEAEELLAEASRSDHEVVKESSRGLSAQRDTPGSNDKNISDPEGVADIRVIAKTFDDRSADSLKRLALALIAHPNVVALLGSRDADTARLIFARSSDAIGDMNALMRKACEIIGGRGGGKPDMAQGGGKNVDALDQAIKDSKQSLIGPQHD